MFAPPPPRRRLLAIAAGGIAAAALVLVVGTIAERLILGGSEAAMRARVERDVRSSFDAMARSLKDTALTLSDPLRLAAATRDDTAAARDLFDTAERVVNTFRDAELAVTLYAADGTPVAWAGRPSDLPSDRLAGGQAWFFAQGAMGLRLVFVAPVVDQAKRRIGTVAAERTLTEVSVNEADGAFMFPTRFSRVALELNFEAPRTPSDASTFDVPTPDGGRLLTAVVSGTDLARARTRWQRATQSIAIMVAAVVLLLLCGPLVDWRNRARGASTYATALALTVAAVVGGRVLLGVASPADWASGAVFSAAAYASPSLAPLLTSPFDFLVTALAAGALVALAIFGVDAVRVACRHRRLALTTVPRRLMYVLTHLAAGALVAAVFAIQVALIRDTVTNATVDLLHFSLHPWSTSRIALQAGLVVWSASVLGMAVLLLRAASVPWRVPRHDIRIIAATALAWGTPLLVWLFAMQRAAVPERPLWIALAMAVALGLLAPRLKARYRHGAQAFRLMLFTAGLVAPALAFYPTLFRVARESKIELVESRYAPQALNQRQTIQQVLEDSLQQIDAFPLLNDLVGAAIEPADAESLPDRAFQVWRVTGLASYPVTSSVELYGADGRLVSRFAFNLPDDLSAVGRFVDRSCEWDIFEEVSPFFAEERRVLHAGRAACVTQPDGSTRVVGAIVVHAMLDYANLPFIASQNPYLEMLRPADLLQDENLSGRDIDYAVYGWSRTPIYTSGDTAWQLDDETFRRAAESRDARWAQLRRGDELSDVYLTNDRFGIYALGFPVVTPLGHLVNLAELTVLAAGTYLLLLVLNLAFAWLSRRHTSASALLREVRASFYRKLFLAFVLASVVPVVALAIVARNYVATEMDRAVEDEAVRTAAAARRVVEDLVAPRAAEQGAGIDDNLMVWVSRLIDQDVNIFRGSRLQATSERNLFASGLLPTRTPAAVYRGLTLRNEAATVSRERIGTFEYLVAGSPVKARQVNAILTVPLTARQRQIEEQVDLLNRQVLLGALLCILAGAVIGYSLAERIADPVNRLTRATRRIARGELDVRVAATSSDELRRLVQDFNRMAHELQQQRRELERTHRLEAWAEMSRQVAHDIKNPLTPIQLNAEHLRRVHADRGEPLSPVLEECVGNILAQVTLLRQIASEFSSFAASPTVRRAPVDLGELLREIIGPYRTGLADRIRFDIDLGDLPHVEIDRSLVSRALTNVIENALHAMPSGGTLTIVARADAPVVRVRVSDTGHGMDPEALARAFEPYFSTKATGTGLGLPIAKRNIELNGGEIAITTGAGGTTVEVALPMAEREAYSALR